MPNMTLNAATIYCDLSWKKKLNENLLFYIAAEESNENFA